MSQSMMPGVKNRRHMVFTQHLDFVPLVKHFYYQPHLDFISDINLSLWVPVDPQKVVGMSEVSFLSGLPSGKKETKNGESEKRMAQMVINDKIIL